MLSPKKEESKKENNSFSPEKEELLQKDSEIKLSEPEASDEEKSETLFEDSLGDTPSSFLEDTPQEENFSSPKNRSHLNFLQKTFPYLGLISILFFSKDSISREREFPLRVKNVISTPREFANIILDRDQNPEIFIEGIDELRIHFLQLERVFFRLEKNYSDFFSSLSPSGKTAYENLKKICRGFSLHNNLSSDEISSLLNFYNLQVNILTKSIDELSFSGDKEYIFNSKSPSLKRFSENLTYDQKREIQNLFSDTKTLKKLFLDLVLEAFPPSLSEKTYTFLSGKSRAEYSTQERISLSFFTGIEKACIRFLELFDPQTLRDSWIATSDVIDMIREASDLQQKLQKLESEKENSPPNDFLKERKHLLQQIENSRLRTLIEDIEIAWNRLSLPQQSASVLSFLIAILAISLGRKKFQDFLEKKNFKYKNSVLFVFYTLLVLATTNHAVHYLKTLPIIKLQNSFLLHSSENKADSLELKPEIFEKIVKEEVQKKINSFEKDPEGLASYLHSLFGKSWIQDRVLDFQKNAVSESDKLSLFLDELFGRGEALNLKKQFVRQFLEQLSKADLKEFIQFIRQKKSLLGKEDWILIAHILSNNASYYAEKYSENAFVPNLVREIDKIVEESQKKVISSFNIHIENEPEKKDSSRAYGIELLDQIFQEMNTVAKNTVNRNFIELWHQDPKKAASFIKSIADFQSVSRSLKKQNSEETVRFFTRLLGEDFLHQFQKQIIHDFLVKVESIPPGKIEQKTRESFSFYQEEVRDFFRIINQKKYNFAQK